MKPFEMQLIGADLSAGRSLVRFLSVLLIVSSALIARGQMVTGSGMEDFGKTFAISAKGWSVQQIGCSQGANALWPGDEATFTFFLKPGLACKGPVKVEVIQYGFHIYQVMAEAVIEARQEAGIKVLIGGACSSTNTRDKLFSDGTDTFLPWLDFVSIHYQPLAADPVLEPKWMQRQGSYGRVRVWDTESWVANSDDRVASVIASMRAMGQDRAAGIYAGNIFTSQKPRIQGKEYTVAQVWAPGAAVAACHKFIGQRAFKEVLFKNGLPWVFVFDGLPKRVGLERTGTVDSDDGTMVITGDLSASYDKNRTLFRSVALTKDARLELSDAGGQFVLLDFYGNPLPSLAGRITVPLNQLGYFLRTDGRPGSFAKLLQALAKATITGVEPVEIVASDMTAPVAAKPKLKIRVTNVLNRPGERCSQAHREGQRGRVGHSLG